ncbi:MAG TPA: dTDP-4-dehydrorhamnose 3,5-epimerase family protein [Terriglobia bacterium]|nr:dTDP-4-dehydrorhamnose 3,5-epimerase family protein [Terriglobia bacterium]
MVTKASGNDQLIQNLPEKRLIGERVGLRLALPHREAPGIGDVITSPQSSRLIAGVEIEPSVQWPDDRGCFAEIFRFGAPGIAHEFSPGNGHPIQISFTVSYPGVIKAIHYHFEQTDLWAPLAGMFQVFLCDLREDSPTWSRLNTLFIGSQRQWKVKIPPGVAHGYKVIGTEPAQLLYATNHFYDPNDEGRIAFDERGINYDWESRPR